MLCRSATGESTNGSTGLTAETHLRFSPLLSSFHGLAAKTKPEAVTPSLIATRGATITNWLKPQRRFNSKSCPQIAARSAPSPNWRFSGAPSYGTMRVDSFPSYISRNRRHDLLRNPQFQENPSKKCEATHDSYNASICSLHSSIRVFRRSSGGSARSLQTMLICQIPPRSTGHVDDN